MRVLQTLVAASIAAAASMANAAIITTWSYTVTSAFDVGTVCFDTAFVGGTQVGVGCAVPTANPANTTTTGSSVSWGVPTNITGLNPSLLQSSLVISGSPATSTIDTTQPPFSLPTGTVPPGNEIGLTQTFTHNNNVIFPPSLDFIDVTTTLLLTPLTPPGGAPGVTPPVSGPASLTFHINFQETPNATPCDPSGATVCPDIFVIGGGLNNFSFFYDSDGVGGDPAQQYFVQIFPFPPGSTTLLQTLSDVACAKAGAASGCQGFITEENQANSVQFAFALTTEPFRVPEPGTLALFAAALVGVGFTVRKRQA
jgi:hypothetical protein